MWMDSVLKILINSPKFWEWRAKRIFLFSFGASQMDLRKMWNKNIKFAVVITWIKTKSTMLHIELGKKLQSKINQRMRIGFKPPTKEQNLWTEHSIKPQTRSEYKFLDKSILSQFTFFQCVTEKGSNIQLFFKL